MEIKKLQDNLMYKDGIDKSKGLQFRTEVIAGLDAFEDKNGVTQFGEILFKESNMVTLGGALYILEKVFGVQSSLSVEYLENIMTGVKLPGETPIVEIYPATNTVCLFGVGIGGCGDSYTDIYPVRYYNRIIDNMIPIRQIPANSQLLPTEKSKYWFRKVENVNGSDKLSFYLKSFEVTPTIKATWRDGVDDEEGSVVASNVHETSPSNTTPIDTFVEMTMMITKKDIREYFVNTGTTERTRFNTLGLFTGVKHKVKDETGVDGEFDYRQVKLFSKLNFANDMLTTPKDITISYKIYLS